MENDAKPAENDSRGLTFFVVGRVLIALVAAVALLWAMTLLFGMMDRPQRPALQSLAALDKAKGDSSTAADESSKALPARAMSAQLEAALTDRPAAMSASPVMISPSGQNDQNDVHLSAPSPAPGSETSPAVREIAPGQNQSTVKTAPPAIRLESTHSTTQGAAIGMRPVGVALVDAIIAPLEFELNKRFWGWRPNDLINITDNINNVQLGVLETTRRAVVQLAQRISRTGSTDAFDRNLENAMSWIMTKPTGYWFPSPESRYNESLQELRIYKAKLTSGRAYFYTRADNLIPLFEVFEDLLGSCDQNLVKQTEADGTRVGYFKTDDYFFYAKGVAHAMATILEGVQIDFAKTMENRRSGELLHHAIESCRRAAELDPWMITNAGLDGILANHRANMAAPISHARYYLGQLIITLST